MSIQPFFLLIFFISPMVSSTSLPPSPSVSLAMDTNMTALQMHVAFFDRDNDGIIYPKETYQGFRAIGCGVPLASVGASFIHLGLSSKTRPGQPPSASLPIEVRNIAKGKHGSDSGVYDAEGRFVPDKFEKIFQEHSHTKPDALTGDELSAMLKANKERQDYGGRLASWTEWKVLYTLAKDKDGFLHKETIRAVYDGTLFHQMEKNKPSV